jgi:hypothetical protein
MVLSIIISLKEHRSSGDERSISCYGKLTGRIRVSKDWLMKEAVLQGQE